MLRDEIKAATPRTLQYEYVWGLIAVLGRAGGHQYCLRSPGPFSTNGKVDATNTITPKSCIKKDGLFQKT